MLVGNQLSVVNSRQKSFLDSLIFLKVNSSGCISLLFSHIGGQTPASFYLAPNLAVRYGLIRLSGVPSYRIRVWPGGQGHHVVYTGLLI